MRQTTHETQRKTTGQLGRNTIGCEATLNKRMLVLERVL